MIIETSANQTYWVQESNRADLAHVWLGGKVRFDRKANKWVKKGSWGAYPELVRKAGSRVIDASVEKIQ